MATRTTVYLDDQLLARARRHVPARGLSELLSELLRTHIDELERRELEQRMRDGYQAVAAERRALAEAWRSVDDEGWPA